MMVVFIVWIGLVHGGGILHGTLVFYCVTWYMGFTWYITWYMVCGVVHGIWYWQSFIATSMEEQSLVSHRDRRTEAKTETRDRDEFEVARPEPPAVYLIVNLGSGYKYILCKILGRSCAQENDACGGEHGRSWKSCYSRRALR